MKAPESVPRLTAASSGMPLRLSIGSPLASAAPATMTPSRPYSAICDGSTPPNVEARTAPKLPLDPLKPAMPRPPLSVATIAIPLPPGVKPSRPGTASRPNALFGGAPGNWTGSQ